MRLIGAITATMQNNINGYNGFLGEIKMLHKSYEQNTKGRDYVVGDIHGCFTRLEKELADFGFDKNVDRLFSVGDLVDRGDESYLVDQYLQYDWFIPVRGNHDDMTMRYPNGRMDVENYRANGGGWNIDRSPEESATTAELMKKLPVAIDVMVDGLKIGIVHAECPYNDWDAFTEALIKGGAEAKHVTDMAMWQRQRITERDESPVKGVDALFAGHTPVQQPVQLGNVFYTDTGAVFGRPFTIICLRWFVDGYRNSKTNNQNQLDTSHTITYS